MDTCAASHLGGAPNKRYLFDLMNTYQRWKELGKPVDYLMECWLASQSSDLDTKRENDWAFMEPADEARENPDKAWEYILFAVKDHRFSSANLAVLAAGALEDLLSHHGSTYIDRVEYQARINSRFAWMLGGVWKFQMTDEVWNRVQAVWDRHGWDGNTPTAQ